MRSTFVEEYTNFLAAERHRSRNTIDSYRRDVIQYITYLDSTGCHEPADATRSNVMSYLISLQEKGRAASSVSRALAALKSFHTYLMRRGTAKYNPTESVEVPKPERSLPSILSEEETEQLLAAPDCSDYKGMRDKAMLELLYATGMRVTELISLNMSDVNIPMCYILCHNTRNNRPLPIGRSAVIALEAYMKNARPYMIRSSAESALFVNTNGSRLTRQGFWKIIKHYGEEAGIQTEITPNTMRHSFAAHLVHHGADLDSIKDMMGHADIASTRMYTHLPDTKLRQVYEKTHPRAK